MARRIKRFSDLVVYQRAFDASMSIFAASKSFPKEETYSLTDQIRRSSRSVFANIAEAWGKRRYEAAFVGKLSDSETETYETQAWLQVAVKCKYLEREPGAKLFAEYDEITAMLVEMIRHPSDWVLP